MASVDIRESRDCSVTNPTPSAKGTHRLCFIIIYDRCSVPFDSSKNHLRVQARVLHVHSEHSLGDPVGCRRCHATRPPDAEHSKNDVGRQLRQ